MFNNEWDNILLAEMQKPYYLELREFLLNEDATQTIYPHQDEVFNALRSTTYNAVKAVILGQDPYHGTGQAHGLCFSVPAGIALPPSLKNIFKELQNDLGIAPPRNGDLNGWAKNGVLLLNTVLTVRENAANSHQGRGWEIFTDKIIALLNEREKPIAFLLWGNHAIAKKSLVTNSQHKIFTAPHPSPLSAHRGFFGCRHFSQTNEFLHRVGLQPIEWNFFTTQIQTNYLYG